jgi:ribonuclease D
MKTILSSLLLIALGLTMNGGDENEGKAWRGTLASRLKLYGHRNWIVIADAAYPSQSRPGIETIATSEDQLKVLEEVLNAVSTSKHVRAQVYCDKELNSVMEKDAPGIDAYRNNLHRLLKGHTIHTPLHEELISKIDESARTFDVLILKSTLTLPYTSVFLELGCGYWDDGAEMRLRDALKEE